MKRKLILYYNDLVFYPSESFLYKDFGQVPYVLSELYDLDLEYWISAQNPNKGFQYFRGKIVRQYAKSFRWLSVRWDPLKNVKLYYKLMKTKDFSHILIFPFTPTTDFIVAVILKMRNRNIKIILKLDTNAEFLNSIEAQWSSHVPIWKRIFRQTFYYRALLKIADLVVCETTDCEKILRSNFMKLDIRHKLVKTFSGLSKNWLSSLGIEHKSNSERNNSIIVSGRISSWMKYTSLIFEAGPPPPGWRIEFVGEVDNDLAKVIETYRKTSPTFDNCYKFHGLVVDKIDYFNILTRARALLMNSRGFEGFPNVFAEAHYCGLFILTSDVSGASDATCQGKWGVVYPAASAQGLRSAFEALTLRMSEFGAPSDDYEHWREAFVWENSLNHPAFHKVFGERLI